MDISKYLTNKDIQLSNDDINIEKLEKDIRKGYVLSDEVETARKEALKESTATYTELEDKYNKLEKTYGDMEARNTELSNSNRDLKLQVEMVAQGFKKEDFKEVSTLRTSLYADEEDDAKAITMIKEKFGSTYIPKQEEPQKSVDIPEDKGMFNQSSKKQEEIKITRDTSIKNLIIK
jgi:hypothetical protein